MTKPRRRTPRRGVFSFLRASTNQSKSKKPRSQAKKEHVLGRTIKKNKEAARHGNNTEASYAREKKGFRSSVNTPEKKSIPRALYPFIFFSSCFCRFFRFFLPLFTLPHLQEHILHLRRGPECFLDRHHHLLRHSVRRVHRLKALK